jgi:hypothetical protein
VILRSEAKELLADARPQARKIRRRIRWNTLRNVLSRERRRCLRIVCRSRMALLGQTPNIDIDSPGKPFDAAWTSANSRIAARLRKQ